MSAMLKVSEAAMPYAHILVQQEDSAQVITLNRPEKRNALSLEMMQELTSALEETASGNLRAVIIAAAGKVFSSGHDLSELSGREEADYRKIFSACNDLMLAIRGIPQPVIAEVQGLATAAGCQLVAACDLAAAAAGAGFATPGVRIGLFCSTPMVPLTRAVGRKRAMEMLLTGRVIPAETAAEWGLVNRVVPAASLRAATRELAAAIAQASSYTVAVGKRAFYEQIDAAEVQAYRCASEVMVSNSQAEDAREGISAFLTKRAPVWSGR
jgi:enoyl-CoA hydratase/carnithine racemase